MAVTKIKKTASFTLWALIAISVLVVLLFFCGGSTITPKGNVNYNFTDALLYWTYLLSGLTVLASLGLGLAGYFSELKHDPKKALLSLSGVLLLVVVLGVSYLLGDDTKLTTINADNQAYNTATWLKVTDMWLYTIYIMFTLVVLSILWGSLRKLFSK